VNHCSFHLLKLEVAAKGVLVDLVKRRLCETLDDEEEKSIAKGLRDAMLLGRERQSTRSLLQALDLDGQKISARLGSQSKVVPATKPRRILQGAVFEFMKPGLNRLEIVFGCQARD
jgi:hypothetical protein